MKPPGSKIVGTDSVLFRGWASLSVLVDVVDKLNNWQESQSILPNIRNRDNAEGDVIPTVLNLSNTTFTDHSYVLPIRQSAQ